MAETRSFDAPGGTVMSRWGRRLAALALSLALGLWFCADGRWMTLGEVFARLSPGVIALTLAGLLVSYVLRALRVYEEFRHDDGVKFSACLRIVLIHNAAVNVMPFRGGEAAFPVLLGRTFGTPLTRALASLFWFRLQDALVVAVVAVMVWPGLPWALRVAGGLALLAFAFFLPRWAQQPHDWAGRGALAGKFAKLRDAFAESSRHARLGWWWTVANWSVKLAAQSCLLAALLDTSMGNGAAGALGAELAAILPIQGVAGFGTYEAGAAAALLPHGISLNDGLKAALALHVFIIMSALCAAALAMAYPHSNPPSPTFSAKDLEP
ncbi:hypothetical protein AGMMS49960_01600 [Betaproteobacteria bacterium]|nr:hypothetical protein AGMMS49543_24570 [Betaproteobacteria bacterium]GHT98476.1 hypothetical protein AGMMS49960_01600 [Betaproteobacteria bacterium]GHU16840.1 hypothetical protein AGMMS50243_03940 [Betaproteobacteria bacterium]